jgi:hypothetical protein
MLESVPADLFAAGLLLTGIIFLAFGWSLYRVILFIIGCGTGASLGAGVILLARAVELQFLAQLEPLYLMIPLALICGVAVLMMEKVGIFLAGGACLGILLWLFVPREQAGNLLVLIVGVGVVVGGVGAVFLWKPLVVICISTLGAMCACNGLLLAMDRHTPGLVAKARPYFITLVPVSLFALTLGGILFQTRHKKKEEEV